MNRALTPEDREILRRARQMRAESLRDGMAGLIAALRRMLRKSATKAA